MRFGWEGFLLELPEDWALSSLTGHRRRGYVSFSHSFGPCFQLSWRQLGPPRVALERYLASVEASHKKSKRSFQSSFHESDLGWEYKFSGETKTYGCILSCSQRLLWLETMNSGLNLAEFRGICKGVKETTEPLLWSLYGSEVRLPSRLQLSSHQFFAGRTILSFSSLAHTVRVERWAMGARLIESAESLENWGRALMKLPSQVAECRAQAVLFSARRRFSATGVVYYDEARDQLTAVRSQSVDPRKAAQWDWLLGADDLSELR